MPLGSCFIDLVGHQLPRERSGQFAFKTVRRHSVRRCMSLKAPARIHGALHGFDSPGNESLESEHNSQRSPEVPKWSCPARLRFNLELFRCSGVFLLLLTALIGVNEWLAISPLAPQPLLTTRPQVVPSNRSSVSRSSQQGSTLAQPNLWICFEQRSPWMCGRSMCAVVRSVMATRR